MEVLNEDWNEDFVFEGREEEEEEDGEGEQQQQEEEAYDGEFWGYDDHHGRVGAGPFEGHNHLGVVTPAAVRTPLERTKARSVIVPQAIKERQANVHGDLGQVRDFALLVEELKQLRMIATSKGIVEGPSAELWHEADDIIDLASPENDHHAIQPPCSPSSPGFGLGFDPFEDEPSPVPAPSRKRRKSVLSLDGDFYDAPSPATTQRDKPPENATHKVSPSLSRMPSRSSRHESPSVAKTVIETIHQRRLAPSPSAPPPKKMPFDSTTLRELVAHVRMLSRRLAELVVIAESPLSSRSQSPHLSPPPSFGQVLSGSVASSPSSFGTPRPPAKKSKNATEVLTPIKGKENELNGHILMAVI